MRRVRCVGAVVRDGDRVLLVQRANEPARGRWSIPGGRVEAGEDDPTAVARELLEETGLSVEVGDFLGVVSRPGPDDVEFDIHDYRASVGLGNPPHPVAGTDASAVGWFSRAEAEKLPTSDGLIEQLAAWQVW